MDHLKFFIGKLNWLYRIKAQLGVVLNILKVDDEYQRFHLEISAIHNYIEQQIVALDQVYTLVDSSYSYTVCSKMIGLFAEGPVVVDDVHIQSLTAYLFSYSELALTVEKRLLFLVHFALLKLEDKRIPILLTNIISQENDDSLLLLLIKMRLASDAV